MATVLNRAHINLTANLVDFITETAPLKHRKNKILSNALSERAIPMRTLLIRFHRDPNFGNIISELIERGSIDTGSGAKLIPVP